MQREKNAFMSNLTLKTIPQIVVPVFLAVGNLAPIFSNMAFLTNNQTVKMDEASLCEQGVCLSSSPFTIFKRKSATMFWSYSTANGRHLGKFCGVILSVHVLTPETAEGLWALEPSLSLLSRWRNILSVCPLSLF